MHSKATNPKRNKAENAIYALMHDIDPTGNNEQIYSDMFSSMNDSEFKTMMKQFIDDPRRYHLSIQANQSKDEEKILDLKKVEALAKKYKVKLKEHVFLPHLNPTDPDHPFVSDEVPILIVYVRKMQQMLDKKNQVVGDIDKVNPLLGQVTGSSKAAAINDTQTTGLVTSNQTAALKELLGPRADNMPAKLKMLSEIEKFGVVKYSDLNTKLSDSQSLKTSRVFFRGALLDTDVLTQKNVPVDKPPKD
jgi:hypothetical protein